MVVNTIMHTYIDDTHLQETICVLCKVMYIFKYRYVFKVCLYVQNITKPLCLT